MPCGTMLRTGLNTDVAAELYHQMHLVMPATWMERGKWLAEKTSEERHAAGLQVGGHRRGLE